MGMSSSKSSTTPWKKGQPYLLGAADATQNAYNTNAGNIQQNTNAVTDLIPSMIEKYQQGNPAVNAATSYNTDVLSGKYLDQGNPHLQQMIDQTNNDVRNQTAGALGVKGLTGGSAMADIVSRNLAKNESNLRYQDYTNERNAMAGASAQAPGLSAADVIQVSPMLSTLQSSLTPIQAASGYSGAIGGLLSPYQTTTQPGGWGQQLLGAGAQLGSAAIMASDERLKDDIEKVGKTPGGLPVYSYHYKGDDTPQVGVMAQDVKKKQPKALGPLIGKYMTVDYGKVR